MKFIVFLPFADIDFKNKKPIPPLKLLWGVISWPARNRPVTRQKRSLVATSGRIRGKAAGSSPATKIKSRLSAQNQYRSKYHRVARHPAHRRQKRSWKRCLAGSVLPGLPYQPLPDFDCKLSITISAKARRVKRSIHSTTVSVKKLSPCWSSIL